MSGNGIRVLVDPTDEIERNVRASRTDALSGRRVFADALVAEQAGNEQGAWFGRRGRLAILSDIDAWPMDYMRSRVCGYKTQGFAQALVVGILEEHRVGPA